MNQKKVPQLFLATGATKWADPEHFPWTMGWQPNYQTEGACYAQYLLTNIPNGKIAMLYQNDDYGKDFVKGLMDGLGAKANDDRRRAVLRNVRSDGRFADRQLARLRAPTSSSTSRRRNSPRRRSRRSRTRLEAAAHPEQRLNSVGAVLKPAGSRQREGHPLDAYLQGPDRPAVEKRSRLQGLADVHGQVLSRRRQDQRFTVYGYTVAQTLVQVLKQCGDDLTRANVMKQAANLHDLKLGLLLPGITINTGPNDFAPIKQLQMVRFTGERWELFGPVIDGTTSSS